MQQIKNSTLPYPRMDVSLAIVTCGEPSDFGGGMDDQQKSKLELGTETQIIDERLHLELWSAEKRGKNDS
jgi:hypothetical protein